MRTSRAKSALTGADKYCMKSHSKSERLKYIADANNSKEVDATQSLEHQADSNIQSIIIYEALSIWEIRQMFHRVLAGWASDVLILRQSQLHVMKWKDPDEDNDLGDSFSIAA